MTIFADVHLVGAKGRKIYASPKLICRASSCFIGIRIDSCVSVLLSNLWYKLADYCCGTVLRLQVPWTAWALLTVTFTCNEGA